jgi:CDP-diacylglycerol--glycerol-3-phosphate 3-phosphatidyltransferase
MIKGFTTGQKIMTTAETQVPNAGRGRAKKASGNSVQEGFQEIVGAQGVTGGIVRKPFDTVAMHPLGWRAILTIGNTLTLTRIFFSPIFLILYVDRDLFGIPDTVLPYILLVLLIALESSDALDGYLARKFDQVTDFGKVLDPMADSISVMSIFLAFTMPPVSLPLFVVFLFIYRDSVISTLRTLCAMRGVALAARASGKIKTALQALCGTAITAMLIPHSMGVMSTETLQRVSMYLASFAALYSICSGIEYLYHNFHFVRKTIVRKQKGFRKARG